MKINHINSYLDGGTFVLVCDNGMTYYVDNRLHSQTAGTIYTSYPPQGKIVTGPVLAKLLLAIRELDELKYGEMYKREIFKLMGTAQI